MDVRPGYKQSEVGEIPEDWAISTVGVEFSIQLGKMLDAEKNAGVPKPYLGNRAIQWGRIDLTAVGEIKLTPYDLQRLRLHEGDLLVCEGGEIGRAAVWQQPIEECYYQKALHRLRPLRGYNVRLMLNILQRLASTGFLLNFVTQTSIAHLPKDKFETVPIPVPPTKAEQEAIAEALSDADALIESLEQLLTKKRQIKKGAMQELLTGKKRMPGFSEEWEEKRLGEFVSIRNQKVLPSGVDLDTPCVELDHIGQGNGRLLENSTAQHSTSSKYRFFAGDILFGRLRSYLRKFWHADRDGICSTEIWPLMVDSVQAERGFLFAIVQSDGFIATASISYGTHMPRADWDVMCSFSVRLPKVDEQAAIARILSDMDAEIAALETKLSKARQIKQGMMQELLTGRIRLV